ncbi:hypothetical protein V8E53_013399 [Lactarius tabidus]
MSSNNKSTVIVLDKNIAHSTLKYDDAWLLEVAGIQLLHEATLQDLLCTRNYTMYYILWEHNELLRERLSLRGDPIDHSEVNFLTPVEPMLHYRIVNRLLARHHTKGPHQVQYPYDCHQVSKGTQTEDASIVDTDANTTLMDIDLDTVEGDLDSKEGLDAKK